MKQVVVLITVLFFAIALNANEDKHRLVILADMGNEPDEEQQIFHLLMYANEFDIEGLIAVTGKFLNPNSPKPEKQRLYPELFVNLIKGYSKVYDNLQIHASGWPEPDYLLSIVKQGQKGYGFEDVGEGKSSPGSELLEQILTRDDPRPVYIVVNAGSNTLAQALFDLERKLSEKEFSRCIKKMRVYENGAQDNAGAYICHHYPGIFWIRSNYQTYCYGGPGVDGGYDNKGDGKNFGPHTWKPYSYNGMGQHQWLLKNIIGNHGAFGKYYPLRQFPNGGISFMEGGGTIPWLGLINKGLFSTNNPNWGSWSGRYTSIKYKNVWSKHKSVNKDESRFAPFYMYKDTSDSWFDTESGKENNDIYTPVWRWRRAFQNDFQARMDWCRQPFEKANHNPNIDLNGNSEDKIVFTKAKPGDILSFDAENSTDPDGDKVLFNWWLYKEAGSYDGKAMIQNPRASKIEFEVPKDAIGKQIHIILELKDDNPIVSMYSYRRIVIDVE